MNIHADLMDEYTQDWKEINDPWRRWQFQKPDNTEWFECINHPLWHSDHKYRRKPKTISINGFEVPEPVKTPLENGQTYFNPKLHGSCYYICYEWSNSEFDTVLLGLGLIHLDAESAALHSKALLSFTSIKNYD